MAVYPVAIKDRTAQTGPLAMLARATHGAFFGSKTEPSSGEYAAIASDIRRTWRIDYTTTARPGSTITVRVAQPGSRPLAAGVTIPGSPPHQFLTVTRAGVLAIVAVVVLGLVLVVIVRGGPLRHR